MNTDTVIVCLLSSTLAAALVTSAKELYLWKLNRKAKIEDKKVESRDERIDRQIGEALDKLDKLDKQITASCNSSKFVMKDMIKDTVAKHIEAGGVSFADRSQVHDMWNIYHYELGGNGDLDAIMEIFDELPIKI